MLNTWLVVLPPLIVIVLATITRRVMFSLLLGIVSAALIVKDFQIYPACSLMLERIGRTTELYKFTSWELFWTGDRIFLCFFLIFLGIIITMIRYSGAAYAYSNFVVNKIKNARGAESSSLFLSIFFFIDDYFSCVTVGSVMQSVTDQFRVPRVKLAYMVNTAAAPLVVLIPLSSWAAWIIVQLRSSGVSLTADSAKTVLVAEPFYYYLASIPFFFYAIIAFVALWYVVLSRTSYGIIRKHELYAQKTGELFGGKMPIAWRDAEVSLERQNKSSIIDFIFPVLMLFVLIIGWVLVSGGWLWQGRGFMDALQHSDMSPGFFFGGLGACILSFIFFLSRGTLSLKEIRPIIKEGAWLLGSSIMMLILIWTLSKMLRDDLQTGNYLAQYLVGHLHVALFPVIFFIMAALISSLMGTAWGTMGILIPTALQMLTAFVSGGHGAVTLAAVPMFLPLLGAVVTGSIVGNHLSPISDVMVISATSVGAYHLDLVRAQMAMVVPLVIASIAAFATSGLMIYNDCAVWAAALGSMAVGVGLMIVQYQVLSFINKVQEKVRH